MAAIVEKTMGWLPGGGNAVPSAVSISAAVTTTARTASAPSPTTSSAASSLASPSRTPPEPPPSPPGGATWRSTPFALNDADLSPSAIARVLADHPGPFPVIHITRCRFASHERELAEWLGLLAAKGIQDLVLVNDANVATDSVPLPTDSVPLPTGILRCASLQRLFLGFFTFPDTSGLCLCADVLPHLQELGMFACSIGEWDLLYMLACSPVLEKLTFVFSSTLDLIRLRSKSLRCVLLWSFAACIIAVADAPHMERLFLLEAPRGGDDRRIVMIKIASVPNLRALGFLEARFHWLHIGDNDIIHVRLF